MRVFSKALLITVCLHLLGEGIGQPETCKPAECWNCAESLAIQTQQWFSTSHNCSDVLKNCTEKDFNVTIHTTPTNVDEGMTVTVNCTHNIPNGSISWLKDNEPQGKNEILQIKYILKNSVVNCNVSSTCGNYNSTFTIEVKAANHLVVLLICVGAAAGLLMLFAVAMKIALKRGQAQSHARKIQRQQNLDNIHSTVNTVTSYY